MIVLLTKKNIAQMDGWKLSEFADENVYGTTFYWFRHNKCRSPKLIPLGINDLELSEEDFFRYFTFLHMSGINESSLEAATIIENLKMIKEPHYTEATLVEMEAPLLQRIQDLLKLFEAKFPDDDFYEDNIKEVMHRLSFERGNRRSKRGGKRKNKYTSKQ